MPLFAIVYFVSIPIVMGTGAVVAGTKIFGDTADIILQAFAFAVGWPIIVPLYALYLPFKALYYFGEWLGKRLK